MNLEPNVRQLGLLGTNCQVEYYLVIALEYYVNSTSSSHFQSLDQPVSRPQPFLKHTSAVLKVNCGSDPVYWRLYWVGSNNSVFKNRSWSFKEGGPGMAAVTRQRDGEIDRRL